MIPYEDLMANLDAGVAVTIQSDRVVPFLVWAASRPEHRGKAWDTTRDGNYMTLQRKAR